MAFIVHQQICCVLLRLVKQAIMFYDSLTGISPNMGETVFSIFEIKHKIKQYQVKSGKVTK